jgi:hypothetical protein
VSAEEKIVGLDGKPRDPIVDHNQEIVRILGEFIEETKQGKVVGCVIAVVRPDEVITTQYHGKSGFLLAAAERLRHCINLAMDKDAS